VQRSEMSSPALPRHLTVVEKQAGSIASCWRGSTPKYLAFCLTEKTSSPANVEDLAAVGLRPVTGPSSIMVIKADRKNHRSSRRCPPHHARPRELSSGRNRQQADRHQNGSAGRDRNNGRRPHSGHKRAVLVLVCASAAPSRFIRRGMQHRDRWLRVAPVHQRQPRPPSCAAARRAIGASRASRQAVAGRERLRPSIGEHTASMAARGFERRFPRIRQPRQQSASAAAARVWSNW